MTIIPKHPVTRYIMQTNNKQSSHPLLILISGITGAIGSTLGAAVASLHDQPERVQPALTTGTQFPFLPLALTNIAGWDIENRSIIQAIGHHGVLSPEVWTPVRDRLNDIPVLQAPAQSLSLSDQIDSLHQDMNRLRNRFPDAVPVLVNLLPAAPCYELDGFECLDSLKAHIDPARFPDMAYVLASLEAGIPVVNFTPNVVEIPAVIAAATRNHVPICGRDGKTGQTYFKVVLASAFKARNLMIDGWYSLNILGNSDGANLMDPDRCAGKLANKTQLLDDILEYPVGAVYGSPCHKVHIDYYPPRGDAKEAWDVIDFKGLFGLPMSLRLNLQGRDSILAAPMVLDLARWMAALKLAGISGLIPEMGFYFKKPLGETPALTFQDQIQRLQELFTQIDDITKPTG